MLIRSLCLVILLFGSALFAVAQDNKEKAPATETKVAPTLEETTAWLKEKITKYAGYSKKQADQYSSDRFEEVGFDSCTMRFTDVFEAGNPYGKLSKVVLKNNFSLTNIDPARIIVEKKVFHYLVKMPTRNDEEKIKSDIFTVSLDKPRSTSSLIKVSTILFTDKALAEQVARVLRYAASLCAVQKS